VVKINYIEIFLDSLLEKLNLTSSHSYKMTYFYSKMVKTGERDGKKIKESETVSEERRT
jgi:hypothetical protein